MAIDPTGNTATLLKDVGVTNTTAINTISDLIGTAADWTGVLGGVVGIVTSLLNTGPSLSDILAAIQKDFQLLSAQNQASQILAQATTLNGYVAPAFTQVEGLQAEVAANPSPAEIVSYIGPCVTALGDLYGPVQPDLVWNLTAGWPIYWTDIGQYYNTCYTSDPVYPNGIYWTGDVGYGPKTPPLNADGKTVFYYTYTLPLYMRAVAALLIVGKALDPNFRTNYADVIRTASTALRTQHDRILNNGIMQLVPPNWVANGLIATASPGIGNPHPPGVRIVYAPTDPGHHPSSYTGAAVEYGVVEEFSGYSAVGGNYTFSLGSAVGVDGYQLDNSIGDPTLFNKLQIRLAKRMKDVYVGVGLVNVWQTINILNSLIGDPLVPRPGLIDWSFRWLFETAEIKLSGSVYSSRALALFMITTQPFDTPYSSASSAGDISLRALLTNFND